MLAGVGFSVAFALTVNGLKINSLETEYITRYLGLKRKTNKIKLQKKTIEFKYSLHFTTFHVFLKFVKINVEKKYKYVISAKENWIKVDLDNGREC